MPAALPMRETFCKRVSRNTTQELRRILFDGVNVVKSLFRLVPL
jgi:hypothetical protein